MIANIPQGAAEKPAVAAHFGPLARIARSRPGESLKQKKLCGRAARTPVHANTAPRCVSRDTQRGAVLAWTGVRAARPHSFFCFRLSPGRDRAIRARGPKCAATAGFSAAPCGILAIIGGMGPWNRLGR